MIAGAGGRVVGGIVIDGAGGRVVVGGRTVAGAGAGMRSGGRVGRIEVTGEEGRVGAGKRAQGSGTSCISKLLLTYLFEKPGEMIGHAHCSDALALLWNSSGVSCHHYLIDLR